VISLTDDKLRIGQVAEQAGRRKSAIRYYEEIGLLPQPQRVAGQRVYDRSVLRRLALIDVSQRAGLSLDEIRELLDAGSAPVSDQLQALARRKLPEVEALIRRAEAMRDWLRTAESCSCQSIDECGLFDSDLVGREVPELTVVPTTS
jgi:MerR family transcriptional regulator, redox-sensitive transcriptional activator SoxR